MGVKEGGEQDHTHGYIDPNHSQKPDAIPAQKCGDGEGGGGGSGARTAGASTSIVRPSMMIHV